MSATISASAIFSITIAAAVAAADPPRDLEAAIAALRAVGPEGRGNAEASRAWAEAARRGAADIPRLLAALDGANPLAANWIRAAADEIAERELARGGALPAPALEEFVLDLQHDPRARRLAARTPSCRKPHRRASSRSTAPAAAGAGRR